MPQKPKFKPEVTRVKLNPEQAVLTCDCYRPVGVFGIKWLEGMVHKVDDVSALPQTFCTAGAKAVVTKVMCATDDHTRLDFESLPDGDGLIDTTTASS